ncbi:MULTISPECIES: hypothetical protein [Pedobacter]|uniref:Transposase (putative) YhgA-like domain-containing protein n=1 Tax=Pedobacter heparinus (strain ATCC 13125 / DSM 2366 / CIP 104194 / JCM 7457 / NBRC 12017 / NCIMB 9290 / NRRL B-14731 / HIM 762-3) TaxID=485917 RepID=C6XVT6_PEDHD|nr:MULTISPECIES: hypothetical protein [Pedobacter]ACU06161.1 hypothetical protein Phep_3970 [Pedobacter heparinus DSM 2366]MBB5439681.1 hypothetical protein [Pedobacter sp. AK017]
MEKQTIAVIPLKELNNEEERPRRKDDEFLKGAFEDNFPDFLRFVFSDADEILDFNREIEFLNNELFTIIPDRERKGGGRRADLLAKLYLKDGTEKWVLLNVEIEGGNDRKFGQRVFEYNYRIRDKYKVSVASIAVFTGKKTQLRPTEYLDELLGTVLSFKYTAYHVFDHQEDELLKSDNPFSLIALACQKALLEGKIPDEELADERLVIVKALLRHGYDRQRIISFILFLKNFIFIESEEINRKFDQQIEELTKDKNPMGVIDVFKKWERQEAKIEGKLEGRREEALEIARELKKEGLTIEFIAKTTKLPIAEIEKL